MKTLIFNWSPDNHYRQELIYRLEIYGFQSSRSGSCKCTANDVYYCKDWVLSGEVMRNIQITPRGYGWTFFLFHFIISFCPLDKKNLQWTVKTRVGKATVIHIFFLFGLKAITHMSQFVCCQCTLKVEYHMKMYMNFKINIVRNLQREIIKLQDL